MTGADYRFNGNSSQRKSVQCYHPFSHHLPSGRGRGRGLPGIYPLADWKFEYTGAFPCRTKRFLRPTSSECPLASILEAALTTILLLLIKHSLTKDKPLWV